MPPATKRPESPFHANFQKFLHFYHSTNDEALKLFYIQRGFLGAIAEVARFWEREREKGLTKKSALNTNNKSRRSGSVSQKSASAALLSAPSPAVHHTIDNDDPMVLLRIPEEDYSPISPGTSKQDNSMHSLTVSELPSAHPSPPKFHAPSLHFLHSELESQRNSFILKAEILDLMMRMILASEFGGRNLVSVSGSDSGDSRPTAAHSSIPTFIQLLIKISLQPKDPNNHEDSIYRIRALKVLISLISLPENHTMAPAPSNRIHSILPSTDIISCATRFISGHNMFLVENYLLFLFDYLSWMQGEMENNPEPHSIHTQHNALLKHTPTVNSIKSAISFLLEHFSLFSRFARVQLLESFFRVFVVGKAWRAVKVRPSMIILRSIFVRHLFETDDLALLGVALKLLFGEATREIEENEEDGRFEDGEPFFRSTSDLVYLVKQLIFLVQHHGVPVYGQLVALGWMSWVIDEGGRLREDSNKNPPNASAKNSILSTLWNAYSRIDSSSPSSSSSSKPSSPSPQTTTPLSANLLFPQSFDSLQLKYAKSALFIKVMTSNPNLPTQPQIKRLLACFSDYKYFTTPNPPLEKIHDLLLLLVPHTPFHGLIVDVLVENLHHNKDVVFVLKRLVQRSGSNSILTLLHHEILSGRLHPSHQNAWIGPGFQQMMFLIAHIVEVCTEGQLCSVESAHPSSLIPSNSSLSHLPPLRPILRQLSVFLHRYTFPLQLSDWHLGNTVLDIVHRTLKNPRQQTESRKQLLQMLEFCERQFDNLEIQDRAHLLREMMLHFSAEKLSELLSDGSKVQSSLGALLNDGSGGAGAIGVRRSRRQQHHEELERKKAIETSIQCACVEQLETENLVSFEDELVGVDISHMQTHFLKW
eukprot:CAMPEP_0117454490 /NCGR_PEP_ID=MMETSP0759-20121206/10824_1 /TAXON_ID=63605 /ORGANISM="Percolomonas cosmopolitus, Strain WS" /LENGTH=873 /DNA_ID=CAMNT_0005247671 /DNA_START=86 /DNA_END=2704 /DNA_ORIENTATION=-